MESQLEEYKQQTASELAGLQSNVISELHTSCQSNNTELLTQLSTTMNTLHSNLVSELEKTILSNLTQQLQKTHENRVQNLCGPVPTSSLLPTTNIPHPSPTNGPLPSPTDPPLFSCGGTGGWRCVVYLNFTDPNTPCPSGWRLTSHSKRTCGRVNTGGLSCDSVTFPVSGGDYTRVCGRIIAYQDRYTSGFRTYHDGVVTTIDGAYVSGVSLTVSLTHGSPRQHIWTFAGGLSEKRINPRSQMCPCDTTINITIPPFVGGDYFCESGRHPGDPHGIFYPNNILWDGDGCTTSSTCYSPPYFTKQLPSPTTDDIEARLCRKATNEDTPIEFIELYVQ